MTPTMTTITIGRPNVTLAGNPGVTTKSPVEVPGIVIPGYYAVRAVRDVILQREAIRWGSGSQRREESKKKEKRKREKRLNHEEHEEHEGV